MLAGNVLRCMEVEVKMNGKWNIRQEWQSIQGRAPRAVVLTLFLIFPTSVVPAQEVSNRSEFPFLQDLYELAMEEQKLEHLRSWSQAIGPENGLSDQDARRLSIMLNLYIFFHWREDRLDRDGLIDKLLSLAPYNQVTIDDVGNLLHDPHLSFYFYYSPPEVMFLFALDSLLPDFFREPQG